MNIRRVVPAIEHVLDVDLFSIEQQSVGKQLQRFNAIGKLREFYSGQSLITLVDLPFVFVFLCLIGYLGGLLVFIPLLLLVLFFFFAWEIGVKLKDGLEDRHLCDDQRTDFIIETLGGIHTVKSMGLEETFMRRYESLQAESTLASHSIAKSSAAAFNAGALFTQIMMVSMIATGSLMVLGGSITMGTLVACVLLSGRIMQPVQRVLSIWTRFQDFVLARDKIEELFALPENKHIEISKLNKKRGELEINNLSFSYGTNELPLFKNIDLKLGHGEIISISGAPGCGKTTLLKLIMGLYKLTEGSILIDGVESALYPSDELTKHIGYMPADAVMFHGNIMDNLTSFRRELEPQALEIVKLLGIDSAVARLPKGYDTEVIDGPADTIPPGLKQRLAIGRVLVQKPRILLFDCADRALDKEGYNHVFRLLGRLKGKATMILVSDDRNILHLADREYTLLDKNLVPHDYRDDSKIYAISSYKELQI